MPDATLTLPIIAALYHKWQPARFDDFIGQEQVTHTLRSSVAAGRRATFRRRLRTIKSSFLITLAPGLPRPGTPQGPYHQQRLEQQPHRPRRIGI